MKSQQKERKCLADYVYRTDTSRQSSEFAIITKYLINHIRREYTNGDDIATPLEGKTDFHDCARLSRNWKRTTIQKQD